MIAAEAPGRLCSGRERARRAEADGRAAAAIGFRAPLGDTKPGWGGMTVRALTRRGDECGGRPVAVAALALAIFAASAALAQQRPGELTPSAPGAEVYFVDLKDGATVPEKLKIYFGLKNMG